MMRDQVFANNKQRSSDFEFNSTVAKVFDDMVVRSVPCYLEQQSMVLEFAKKFWIPGTDVYDLGCSTGTTLLSLCQTINGQGKFIGYDNSQPMIEKADQNIEKANLKEKIELRFGDFNGDLTKISLNNASVVTMLWTMQFIRPLQREKLVRWIYNGLVENGVFILMEKVLTNNSDMNRFFIDFYYDFKRKNGYLEGEIQKKREALENVLIPYRIDENVEMLHRNGFQVVEPFFQWFNFAGLICFKKKEE